MDKSKKQPTPAVSLLHYKKKINFIRKIQTKNGKKSPQLHFYPTPKTTPSKEKLTFSLIQVFFTQDFYIKSSPFTTNSFSSTTSSTTTAPSLIQTSTKRPRISSLGSSEEIYQKRNMQQKNIYIYNLGEGVCCADTDFFEKNLQSKRLSELRVLQNFKSGRERYGGSQKLLSAKMLTVVRTDPNP